MNTNPLLGVLLHAVGAMSAAFCYTPQKNTRGWSWQTYWLAQASVCWFILPVVIAWITIPELPAVLAEAPRVAMISSFLLGMLYGVGGTAFGISIRYVGFSLTYAISIGISCVLGTLFQPLITGKLAELFGKVGAGWVLVGVGVATIGIFFSGIAGISKDADLRQANTKSAEFKIGLGLFFCVLAGVLSAVYGISLQEGEPIAKVAAAHGAGQYEGNVVYIFSNTGAFLTTALYCIFLHFRHRTVKEYVTLPSGVKSVALPVNFAMAILTGFLWYGQFFFYGLGHVRMGEYKFTSWAIHMAMLVFFSMLTGLIWREWKGCHMRTWTALVASLVILLVAVALMTYGNYLGSETQP